MYKRITEAWELKNIFSSYGRDTYSRYGYQAMIDDIYTEDYVLDVVEISCEADEYGKDCLLNFKDFITAFGYLVEEEYETEHELIEAIITRVEDSYMVYRLKNGNIMVVG